MDPVAPDYWASKYLLYPIDWNSYHNPDAGGDLRDFLTGARNVINTYGGINGQPVTMDEAEMQIFGHDAAAEPGTLLIRGQGRATVARFDPDGDIVLSGTLYQSATPGQLASTTETEFLVKAFGGEVVARIDGVTGDMYLKGTATTGLSSITPASVPEFVVKDLWGDAAVLIDSSGDLFALGTISENSSP